VVADVFIAARVTPEMKERFAAVARHQGTSQSALLKRLIEAALITAAAVAPAVDEQPKPLAASGKISVRMRPDDLLLLRERAKARAMPSSTYVSFLLRGLRRSLPPLPMMEFSALRKSLMEVAAIGRNFNQIARALNSGERNTGPGIPELQAVLRALIGLRDHFRGLLDANLKSWELGNDEARLRS
jgi:hypothetical protein